MAALQPPMFRRRDDKSVERIAADGIDRQAIAGGLSMLSRLTCCALVETQLHFHPDEQIAEQRRVHRHVRGAGHN
jgi:hypothetical protein